MMCDFRVGSLKLPGPEARDFVRILLQYLDCLGSWQTGVALQSIHCVYLLLSYII